jgi:hypothetical protein
MRLHANVRGLIIGVVLAVVAWVIWVTVLGPLVLSSLLAR